MLSYVQLKFTAICIVTHSSIWVSLGTLSANLGTRAGFTRVPCRNKFQNDQIHIWGYSHGRGDMMDPTLGKSQGTRAYPLVPVLLYTSHVT